MHSVNGGANIALLLLFSFAFVVGVSLRAGRSTEQSYLSKNMFSQRMRAVHLSNDRT